MCLSQVFLSHTRTHTHTHREIERDSCLTTDEVSCFFCHRVRGAQIDQHTHTHTRTHTEHTNRHTHRERERERERDRERERERQRERQRERLLPCSLFHRQSDKHRERDFCLKNSRGSVLSINCQAGKRGKRKRGKWGGKISLVTHHDTLFEKNKRKKERGAKGVEKSNSSVIMTLSFERFERSKSRVKRVQALEHRV
jgi:hypothetical protein